MEPHSPAEELPALYRAILDHVALLENAGDRDEAAHVRSAATRAYSRAWDEQAQRQLQHLLRRAERSTHTEPAPQPERVRRGARATRSIVTQDR